MGALIRFTHGKVLDETVSIRDGAELLIGRDATCDIVLKGRKVSRHHAELGLDDGDLSIRNLSRTNALTVNGQACVEAGLRVGDIVGIGGNIFRVERIDSDQRRRTVIPELGDLPELRDRSQYHGLMRCTLGIQKLLADDIPNLIEGSLEMVFLAIPATRLALFLVTPDHDVLQGFTKLNGPLGEARSRLSHGFARKVLEAGRAILLENVSPADIERYGDTLAEQEVRSVIGVAVRAGDHVAAVVIGDNLERPGALTSDHVGILEFVALALGFAFQRDDLRRLRLHQLETQRQLSAAQLVQRHICNGTFDRQVGSTEWAVGYRPALELCGDFYDVHHDDQGLTCIIADVSGKGMPAALVVSMLRAYCRTLRRLDLPPHAFLLALDHHLQGEIPDGMFVTAALVRVRGDQVEFAGAGHPPLVILRADGSTEFLKTAAGALGMTARPLPAAAVRSATITLGPNDRICLVTDGVVEAANNDDEEFGLERLAACMHALAKETPEAQVEALMTAITRFTGPVNQHDDITVILGRHQVARG